MSDMLTDEEFAKKQAERMRNFIVGSKDAAGNSISKIFIKSDEYVIYEIKADTASESLKVIIDTKTPTDVNGLLERFRVIRGSLFEIKGLLDKSNEALYLSTLKNRIAHVIAHALSGKESEALVLFASLRDQINAHHASRINYRLAFLSTTLVFVLLMVSVAVVFFISDVLPEKPIIQQLTYIAAAGSIGGFLSVIRRANDMHYEKDVNKLLYVFYGIQRICISIFCGIVVFFAVKYDLIFGFIDNSFGYLLLAVLAGFSETFIPNLLIQLEKKSES